MFDRMPRKAWAATAGTVLWIAGSAGTQELIEPAGVVGDRLDAAMPGQVERPVVDPEPKAWVRSRPTRVGVPATQVDLDPAIIGPAPGQPAPPLRREGDFVIDQPGRLRVLANGLAVLDFVPPREPGNESTEVGTEAAPVTPLPSMVLQPCQRLESMLAASEQQGDDVVFRLSGQVHVYRGINYLLPTELTGYQTADPAPAAPAADQAATNDEVSLADAAAALDEPDPADTGVGVTTRSDPRDPAALMDDLADELASDVTDRSVGSIGGGVSAPLDPVSLRQRSASATTGGAAQAAPLLREGELIVSRAGRLSRASDAQQVLLIFEADGPTLAEAPIALLSCRLREYMEDAVTQRGDAQVFTVSGRVFQFQGQNFLLPTMVKLQLPDDNLGG